MTPTIMVIGGGFAGVWAAAGATRVLRGAGAAGTVTLVAPGDDMVIRPRLYEAEPETMKVPLDRILGPVGVHRVKATVTAIDTVARRVTATTAAGARTDMVYDRLILATGSRLARPTALPGAEHLHDVDTIESATALERHLRTLPARPAGSGRYTAVVIGAGFTGLELATELVGRLREIAAPAGAEHEVRVVLVGRHPEVGLGPGPRPVIEAALTGLGVRTRLGVGPREVTAHGVTLDDGTRIPARTVAWTAGIEASPLTADIPAARDELGRVPVDSFLQAIGVPGVYVAGDAAAAYAEPGHQTLPSCQHAIPLGKYAGHNAAADLLGLDPVPFAPKRYVTCLDLGGAGAVFTRGWERTVDLTGAEAKARKRAITEEWIYPPVDDAEELLRQADHRELVGGSARVA